MLKPAPKLRKIRIKVGSFLVPPSLAGAYLRTRSCSRVVKILELTETTGAAPTAPNGLWKTLRANSGPCNVMLRPFRTSSAGRDVQPATSLDSNRSSSLTTRASNQIPKCSVTGGHLNVDSVSRRSVGGGNHCFCHFRQRWKIYAGKGHDRNDGPPFPSCFCGHSRD
jgi:hypothetical protein